MLYLALAGEIILREWLSKIILPRCQIGVRIRFEIPFGVVIVQSRVHAEKINSTTDFWIYCSVGNPGGLHPIFTLSGSW